MSSGRSTKPALGSLRVVEWSGGDLATRFTARLLADFGAEVTRAAVSDGRNGEELVARAMRRFVDAGKRMLPAGDDTVERAIRDADVLLRSAAHALPPAAEAAAAESVGLVRVSIGPLGRRGPLAHWTVGDLEVCALTGVSAVLGEPDRPPLHLPFSIPALQTAFHAAAATLTALRARDRDGRGQDVEVSTADILATNAAGMNLFIAGSRGRWARRGFERHGPIYPSGYYPCRDGYVIMATQSRRPWQGFLKLMGDPDWARQDPAFQDGVAIGWKRADEVDVHFIAWLTQFTRAEILEMAKSVQDLILGPVHEVEETLDSIHLREREFWNEIEVEGRRIRVPGLGYKMSATPYRIGDKPRPAEVTEARRDPVPARSEPGGALAGLRVIEFGWNWAGPLVGQILGDYGAEVIKVETTRRQDFIRHWAHARPFFHNANRNKRSVTIDIATPEGAGLVRELARRSDVVFDNFAAGVLARHGLGFEDFRAVKPELVVLSMAMAGQTGPLRHLRGFAPAATGFAGLEASIGYADTGATGLQLIGLGDLNAAIQAVFSILVALRHRERTGEGQFIDLSQVEAATALMTEPLVRYQLLGERHRPNGNGHPTLAPRGTYPAAGDDRWIAITVRDDAEWQALVGAMGAPEWARAERLAKRSARHAAADEIDRHLSEWTRRYDRDELASMLQRAGVPAAPVLGLEEALAHPQFVGIESLIRDEKEDCAWQMFRSPWRLERTPGEIRARAPEIGADNDSVFGELLGISQAERDRLVRYGVIR